MIFIAINHSEVVYILRKITTNPFSGQYSLVTRVAGEFPLLGTFSPLESGVCAFFAFLLTTVFLYMLMPLFCATSYYFGDPIVLTSKYQKLKIATPTWGREGYKLDWRCDCLLKTVAFSWQNFWKDLSCLNRKKIMKKITLPRNQTVKIKDVLFFFSSCLKQRENYYRIPRLSQQKNL